MVGKPSTVYFRSDNDPSGDDMPRDIERRLRDRKKARGFDHRP